jgi:Cu(I)/Ag(I) efflux system membrane fusion protein
MTKRLTGGIVGFIIGATLVGVAAFNPAGWSWLTGLRGGEVAGTEVQEGDELDVGTPADGERRIVHWRAPMDPTFVSDGPGTSPMGMDLVPVYEDERDAAAASGTVRIDPSFAQNMGVRTELVERRDIALTIRTVGTLAHDDRQIAWVNTKYEGWIENVAVNYVGETVTQGQVLFDIYSPQLVTTQQEYLLAVDYAARLETSDYPDIAARARNLVDAARQRLRRWDVTDAQIVALDVEGTERRTLSVVSPVSGVVVAKMDQALDGMYVRPGMNIYKIADLTTIWVDVEVFENQIGSLRVGQRATVELPYALGRSYTGYVQYLYPHFNEQTRTMTVSIELENPDRTLRADMYANVTFEVPAARDALTVPEEAVIRSGTRDVVVLERGPGTFRVVPVALGANGSGVWEVRDGVTEGDRVVVSAQFLIDSESNLREAISRIGAETAGDTPAVADQP